MNRCFSLRRLSLVLAAATALASTAAATPVMFVTVTPSTGDTVSGTFNHFVSFVGNHLGAATKAPRGGDLYIRYDDGTLRNLTAEAGFGTTPGAEICVREPNVHWNGQKAVFSMAVGGTGASPAPSYFQLYEITGILQGQTAQITKVPGQPANRNNVQPCYATDGSIIFASDEPATRNPAHYPQLDEYESTPVVSGLWRINTDGTNFRLLDHCPSGDFTPIVDSFGRVVFTRWDHLKRDQQADLWIDGMVTTGDPGRAFPITWESENSPNYRLVEFGDEMFPENGRLHPDREGSSNPNDIPHPYWDQDFEPGMTKQDFNHFIPWMIHEDGTEAEVLNHLGRHELFGFTPTALESLPDHFRPGSNETYVRSFNQIREDPTHPGRYYGVDAAEFGTHGAGRILRFDAPLGANADDIPASMAEVTPENPSDWAGNVALTMFRDPMPKSDGTLWAACNGTVAFADNTATIPPHPAPYPMSSNYAFKIRKLVPSAKGYLEPAENLCDDIIDTVTYTSEAFWPPRQVTYTGPMWELFPVEVVPRTPPTPLHAEIPSIERTVLQEELGGDAGIADLKQWLADQNLALIVSRDVTVRGDKQQPYNLKVAWSDHANAEPGETPEDIGYMQVFAARYLRSYTWDEDFSSLDPGRRLLARPLGNEHNPPLAGAPQGSVKIGDDGSMAAFVPAQRALTWQITEPGGRAVVRERYWLTFQPGEVRTCTNCHGLNREDVFGNGIPTNNPQALRDLMQWWKSQTNPSSAEMWTVY